MYIPFARPEPPPETSTHGAQSIEGDALIETLGDPDSEAPPPPPDAEGDALELSLALGDALKLVDALTLWLGDTDGDGLALSEGLSGSLALSEALAETLSDASVDALPLRLGKGIGLGLGEGCWLGLPSVLGLSQHHSPIVFVLLVSSIEQTRPQLYVVQIVVIS